MSDYIQELNEGQRAAVLYNDGPSLVIAGAGSGKTRVLTYKIAYLLENDYQPWNILALTFTNKAAREMKERIARQVGVERARHLWMGTFHSIFLRILHAEAAQIGFTSRFTIYDTADSKSLLRSIIKEMGLDEKVYKPGTVQARISNAKNHLVSPAGYANNKEAYEGDCAARCLPYAIFTAVTGSVAGRRMQWISMICCSTLSCFSAIIRMCLPVISRSSVTSWWTSIRTRTSPSTVLCSNWPRSTSTSVWWAMMHRAFILSGERISTTYCISQKYIRARRSLNWNRTTAPPKQSFLQPTV